MTDDTPTTKRKPGRPRKPDGEKRAAVVRLHLTPAEHASLVGRAEVIGMLPSEYARWAALGAAPADVNRWAQRVADE